MLRQSGHPHYVGGYFSPASHAAPQHRPRRNSWRSKSFPLHKMIRRQRWKVHPISARAHMHNLLWALWGDLFTLKHEWIHNIINFKNLKLNFFAYVIHSRNSWNWEADCKLLSFKFFSGYFISPRSGLSLWFYFHRTLFALTHLLCFKNQQTVSLVIDSQVNKKRDQLIRKTYRAINNLWHSKDLRWYFWIKIYLQHKKSMHQVINFTLDLGYSLPGWTRRFQKIR